MDPQCWIVRPPRLDVPVPLRPLVLLFASSLSEGMLRPHTAPERLGHGGRGAKPTAGIGEFSKLTRSSIPSCSSTAHGGDRGGWVRQTDADPKKCYEINGVHVCHPRRRVWTTKTTPARKGLSVHRTNDPATKFHAVVASSEFRPRTQILGMNLGSLPREVRQAPQDRPLTAPCGEVGRRRVRVHSSRGPVRP